MGHLTFGIAESAARWVLAWMYKIVEVQSLRLVGHGIDWRIM